MKGASPVLVVPILLSAACLVACGGQGEVRKTGGTYAGRGPGCEYRVIRNPIAEPVEPYEEIGVIDIDAFSAQQLPNNEERFRKVVGPKVCALGGDGVIPSVNIYGRWVHGTVVRFHPALCDRCSAEVHGSTASDKPAPGFKPPSVDEVVDDIKREEG
jgi:hypothetical protein